MKVEFTDPNWFPVDLDVDRDLIAFLRITPSTLDQSVFLDTRIEADLSQAVVLPRSRVPDVITPPLGGWLFHTSFCGSTLLARALHLPPGAISLKEPLVLRRISDAWHSGKGVEDWYKPVVALLARTCGVQDRVIVKPTHAALNIVLKLMGATPGTNVVVATSSLEDFVVSNIKKTAETRSRIPLLCERAFKAISGNNRLPERALSPPSVLAAAGLQWALQREVVADIAKAYGDRVRIVDVEDIMADLEGVALNCLAWLKVDAEPAVVRRHTVRISAEHAKSPERAYSAVDRRRESRELQRIFEDELRFAFQWLEREVLPYIRAEALGLTDGPLRLRN